MLNPMTIASIHPLPDIAPRWTAQTVGMSGDILDRMERAVAKVRERLLRATAALNQAGVPYAVVGGNAVASWVATVDEGAVRNTRDVDLLVRRSDLPAVTAALEAGGLRPRRIARRRHVPRRPGGQAERGHSSAVRRRKDAPDHLLPAPEIQTVADPANFRVIALESLVVDEADVEPAQGSGSPSGHDRRRLIDASWLTKLPPELAERLKQILDTPDA